MQPASPDPLTLAPLARRPADPASQRPARDRLQPALLDRLIDEAPQHTRESVEDAAISHAALRQAVLRDLRWLLNTASMDHTGELAGHAAAQSSAINFGLPPLAGKRMSEIDWVDVEDAIRTAIVRFEPRILPDTVQVRCATDPRMLDHHNVLSLEIRGLLWCVPYPRELMLRTDIDLETGHIDLADLGAP